MRHPRRNPSCKIIHTCGCRQGVPNFTYTLESYKVLPTDLFYIHPRGYDFWFSTQANLDAFTVNPWKYIPQFGGHCTHGIASRNDLTPATLTDGRVAFTCVNTTQWVVLNGSLYMNSCGMYADFIKVCVHLSNRVACTVLN